jgi:Uma2 family endonuclease
MEPPAEKRKFTIAEYLAMEEKAVEKHEFHEGEILMMSGGTYRHSVISVNLGAILHGLVKGKHCQTLDSNMRVRISDRWHYVYPDFSIVCGSPVFDPDDKKKTTIINPRVVIEVLSESIELYDRGGKFDLNRQIPSLEEYVLVSQWQPMVETYWRQPQDETWIFNAYKGPSATLRSLQINLPFSEIYAGIDFDA